MNSRARHHGQKNYADNSVQGKTLKYQATVNEQSVVIVAHGTTITIMPWWVSKNLKSLECGNIANLNLINSKTLSVILDRGHCEYQIINNELTQINSEAKQNDTSAAVISNFSQVLSHQPKKQLSTSQAQRSSTSAQTIPGTLFSGNNSATNQASTPVAQKKNNSCVIL